MLEKWVGKVVTYYIVGETDYSERKLIAVDARGIYTQDDEGGDSFFIPYSALRSITFSAQ